MDGAAMVMTMFQHRTGPLTRLIRNPHANAEGLSVPEITSNSVACCVTDIGTGRIWWERRQGHWVIAAKPASAPEQKPYG